MGLIGLLLGSTIIVGAAPTFEVTDDSAAAILEKNAPFTAGEWRREPDWHKYQDAMPNGLRSLESLSAIQCSPEREGCTEYSPSLQAIGSTASALATLPSLAIPAPGGLVAGVSLALIGTTLRAAAGFTAEAFMLGDVLPLVRNGAFERLGPPLDSEEATRREVLAAAEAVAGQLTRAAHGAASADYGHIYNEVEAMHTRMMRSLLAPSAEGSGSARLYVGAEAISASERADLAAHMGGSAFRPATASALLTYVREHSAPADPAGAMCAVWRVHTAIVTLRARAFLLEALSAFGVARGVDEISQRLRTDLQGYEEALQQVQIDMPPGGAGALPNRYAFNLVQMPPFVHTHDEGRHRLTAALPLPIRINHTAWGVGAGADPKCDRNEAPLTFDPFRAWLFPGMSADFFPSSCLCCAPRPVAPSLQTQFSWGCARA